MPSVKFFSGGSPSLKMSTFCNEETPMKSAKMLSSAPHAGEEGLLKQSSRHLPGYCVRPEVSLTNFAVGFDSNHPQQSIEQEFVVVGRLLVFHPPQREPQSGRALLCLNLVNLLNEKVV